MLSTEESLWTDPSTETGSVSSSIVTAYSSIDPEPNIAGVVFVNTRNLIINKSVSGCEIFKACLSGRQAFSIVIIYSYVDILSPIGGCATDGDLPAVETAATIDVDVNTVQP